MKDIIASLKCKKEELKDDLKAYEEMLKSTQSKIDVIDELIDDYIEEQEEENDQQL